MTILSTATMGVSEEPHCDDVGHMMENDHLCGNCGTLRQTLSYRLRNGTSIYGADIYLQIPVLELFKLIANRDQTIFYLEFYRDEKILTVAPQAGIELIKVNVESLQ
jgi:dCMP deaminase